MYTYEIIINYLYRVEAPVNWKLFVLNISMKSENDQSLPQRKLMKIEVSGMEAGFAFSFF